MEQIQSSATSGHLKLQHDDDRAIGDQESTRSAQNVKRGKEGSRQSRFTTLPPYKKHRVRTKCLCGTGNTKIEKDTVQHSPRWVTTPSQKEESLNIASTSGTNELKSDHSNTNDGHLTFRFAETLASGVLPGLQKAVCADPRNS